MAVPSYNFLNGTSQRPFNNTLIGMDTNVFVTDATVTNVLLRNQIHAKYSTANKSWVDFDAGIYSKPNLGFIRPLFSITVEDDYSSGSSEDAGGGGGSATRNLKIGSTTIDSIYLGSSQFTHIYAGSTLIWSQS